MEEILLKQLNREQLSNAEREAFERWIDDPKNVRVYNQLKLELNGPSDLQMESMMGEVWGVLAKEMHSGQSKRLINFLSWIKIAAILLLATLTGALIHLQLYPAADEISDGLLIEKESLYGQKLNFTLPDGTLVKLNSGSKLIYSSDFGLEKREVSLVGEAFFDVKPDPEHPFMITTSDLGVKVLGTSFNVSVYPEEEASVAVKSGKVSVELFADETTLQLDPDEIVSYSQANKKIEKYLLDDNQLVFGWTEKKLIYRNSDINHILEDLSRWYGVEFEIIKALDQTKTISGRYDNPPLMEVMESLSFAYDFEYSIEKNSVIIK